MRKATSRSGVLVVLKIIDDPDEYQLLHYLNGIKAPSNHTIPLLDVINLGSEKKIIVLPWKSPLDGVLQSSYHPVDVVSLCLQFIEGVAFLHQHKVAHCDLKPGNVVVGGEPLQLFIIDFDLAMSDKSEETMVRDWRGTPTWVAPELGSIDGPTQRYSPILADRWACGRMIQHFAKYFRNDDITQETRLRAFSQQLLDINPRARPNLNQLQAIHVPRKRKAEKNQQVPVPKRYAANLFVHYQVLFHLSHLTDRCTSGSRPKLENDLISSESPQVLAQ
jgi:serine/threonine protein kinase